MGSSSTRRGPVLGCGGTLGSAWTVGALVAVRDLLGGEARDAEALVVRRRMTSADPGRARGLGRIERLDAR